MLSKTSLSAIRALVFLGLNQREQPWSPRAIAEPLNESPSYLAKVVRHLVRAGILKAHRGVAGGVSLNRSPREISLRMIVEACQGAILGDFCSEAADLSLTCAFHQAGAELHDAVVRVLSRWTLADFLDRPGPDPKIAHEVQCWLAPCPRMALRVTVGSETDATALGVRGGMEPSQTREQGP
ncbi:MAG: Rrf2 family transcriptional regulator [Thermoguttaceae bacterium]|jgi:Rrf2 family protein|nr:Rrf2 family transcriptional regulator [Thermoguttaceae bacterium]